MSITTVTPDPNMPGAYVVERNVSSDSIRARVILELVIGALISRFLYDAIVAKPASKVAGSQPRLFSPPYND